MTTPKLNPRTHRIRADSVRPGHIVMESDEHPAVDVRVRRPHGAILLWCRYVWQATHEPVWSFGPFDPTAPIEVSKER
ncbi:hypothetical protein [Microbacterium allomyrinae]|uniref:Uncharacterized protein n=1 Tax=Microbacterium allomyrinae TaxID=2830666 RepID=A0A9X1LU86_9MICO|nr:hypothetical protein [Microbacterium allomyrinae]MCC2031848.1 hypothetical protein [Microbacterium allomyrinae]